MTSPRAAHLQRMPRLGRGVYSSDPTMLPGHSSNSHSAKKKSQQRVGEIRLDPLNMTSSGHRFLLEGWTSCACRLGESMATDWRYLVLAESSLGRRPWRFGHPRPHAIAVRIPIYAKRRKQPHDSTLCRPVTRTRAGADRITRDRSTWCSVCS